MTFVALIRHGATRWNEDSRIQGRADIPLSERGRAALQALRAPALLRNSRWHVSPLLRAVETARLLGPGAFAIEPRLIEMHWGAWEGERLAALRARLGPEMQENEDRGLHFRPEGGESPADVQARLKAWFSTISGVARPVTAVTHKGVIRAMLALAYNWDMMGKPPAKLDWDAVHLFDASATGAVVPVALNIAFETAHGG